LASFFSLTPPPPPSPVLFLGFPLSRKEVAGPPLVPFPPSFPPVYFSFENVRPATALCGLFSTCLRPPLKKILPTGPTVSVFSMSICCFPPLNPSRRESYGSFSLKSPPSEPYLPYIFDVGKAFCLGAFMLLFSSQACPPSGGSSSLDSLLCCSHLSPSSFSLCDVDLLKKRGPLSFINKAPSGFFFFSFDYLLFDPFFPLLRTSPFLRAGRQFPTAEFYPSSLGFSLFLDYRFLGFYFSS